MLFQKLNYKEDNKIRTRKLAVKCAKYFGAEQKFISHHKLSSFGLITVEIKLRRSNKLALHNRTHLSSDQHWLFASGLSTI